LLGTLYISLDLKVFATQSARLWGALKKS